MNFFKKLQKKYKLWKLLRLYRRLDEIRYWIDIKEKRKENMQ